MKTLNILSDSELKQIFGPLEDILPLHEGKMKSENISWILCTTHFDIDVSIRIYSKKNVEEDITQRV